MKYIIGNQFSKFLVTNLNYLNIDLLKQHLNHYLEITSLTENNLEPIDLSIVFLRQENLPYTSNFFLLDDHYASYDNGILYIYLNENTESENIFVKRLLTDLSNRFFEKKHGIFLHSSSIVDDNNTIVFIGNKGSGKTTNMLYLLDSENIAYSSNERTGIILSGEQLLTYGNPARINIRANTLSKCKSLREKLLTCIDLPQYTKYSQMNLPNDCSERLVITFDDIEHKLKRDIIPIAPLHSICNLIYTDDQNFKMEEVDYLHIQENLIDSKIEGVFPQRKILNDVFPIQNIALDELLCNGQVKYYNIYQNFKTNNSQEILKVLRKGYK